MEEIIQCINIYEKMTVVLVRIRTIYPEWEKEVNHYLLQAHFLQTEMILGQRDAELTSQQFKEMVRTILEKID